MIWVLSRHENESALSNPKSYNMYFEQQINQKDTKRLASSWFCNAFYDCHIFCLSHWRRCWLHHPLKEAEDVHKQTVWNRSLNQKAVIYALTSGFCIDVPMLLFVKLWLCFYVVRRSVILNCMFNWRSCRTHSVVVNLWMQIYVIVCL